MSVTYVSLRSYFTFRVEMSVTYVSLRSYFTFRVEMSNILSVFCRQMKLKIANGDIGEAQRDP
jgi:hypothetical protein